MNLKNNSIFPTITHNCRKFYKQEAIFVKESVL